MRRMFVVLFLCMAIVVAHGQKKTSPANANDAPMFHVSINLVSVDAVATDKSGKPVTDLKPEEITVFEDGKERPLKSFNLVASSTASVPAQNYSQEIKNTLSKLPPSVTTNLSAVPSLLQQPICTVLLIDALNTPNDGKMQARLKLIDMLNTIDLNQPVAVYGLGSSLVMLQDFTTDRQLLRSALKDAKESKPAGSVSSKGDLIDHTTSDWMEQTLDGTPEQGRLVNSIRGLEFWDATIQLNTRILNTSAALQSIARRLEGVPGRKNLIWATGMFPDVLLPDPATDQSAWLGAGPGGALGDTSLLMLQTASQLESSHISVYPIDASGLQNRSFAIDSDKHSDNLFTKYSPGTMGSSADNAAIESGERHNNMERIARLTGGRAFYDRNDLGKAVASAMNDGSSYYAISFTPAQSVADGRIHSIKLNSSRKGVNFNYRRSYYAYASSEKPEQLKALDEAFRQALNVQHALSTGVVIFSKVSSTKPNMIDVSLDPRSLALSSNGNGLQRLRFDVAAVVFDKTGKPLRPSAQSVDFQITEEQAQQLAAHGLRYQIAYTPTAGAQRVRVGVRDLNSGRIGTVDMKLE